MMFSTWRWGLYFNCPWLAFGVEWAPPWKLWGGEFIKYRRGRFVVAWCLGRPHV